MGAAKKQQSQSWEAIQREEVNNGVSIETLVYDLHPSNGKKDMSIFQRQTQEGNDSQQIKTNSSSGYILIVVD